MARVALPVMPMLFSGLLLERGDLARSASRGIRVEFCQSAELSVPDKTYLTLPFMLSAISPVCCGVRSES